MIGANASALAALAAYRCHKQLYLSCDMLLTLRHGDIIYCRRSTSGSFKKPNSSPASQTDQPVNVAPPPSKAEADEQQASIQQFPSHKQDARQQKSLEAAPLIAPGDLVLPAAGSESSIHTHMLEAMPSEPTEQRRPSADLSELPLDEAASSPEPLAPLGCPFNIQRSKLTSLPVSVC